jgi:hypothetical protein
MRRKEALQHVPLSQVVNEDVHPLFLICRDCIVCAAKRIRRYENPFHYVYDLCRSHREQGK